MYQEHGAALAFVDKQEHADELMKNLLRHSYPCMSLHGGIDQYDRDSTISDFKSGNIKLLVRNMLGLTRKRFYNYKLRCFYMWVIYVTGLFATYSISTTPPFTPAFIHFICSFFFLGCDFCCRKRFGCEGAHISCQLRLPKPL